MSGSGISWAICKSAPRSRQITTPALHYSSFSQAGCPSCRPTNSVKALKELKYNCTVNKLQKTALATNSIPSALHKEQEAPLACSRSHIVSKQLPEGTSAHCRLFSAISPICDITSHETVTVIGNGT